ncbi:phage tail terminator protein [Rhizobium sp. Leaf341]|uniref:phage tail terminator protein n=1 Tax=Rhizobium sp. Leaf341 TaxID=1736344 RepID=UPI001FCD09C0|nr:hypothetical protein [Rhizobium sp. Leaf341]
MIAAVIERLKVELGTTVADVLPVEDLASVSAGTAPRNGTVFVIPYREQAEPNDLAMGGFEQLVHVQILVALVLRRHADVQGAQRALDFDTLKGAIEQALAGWAVDPRGDLFELVSAQAAPLGNGVTVYVQTWQTSRYLETD